MELSNEGVVNLMLAVTERAYSDYVQCGIFLKRCEWVLKDGVIHVDSKNGRKIVSGWEQRKVDKIANMYATALMFLEETNWGEYLIRKGEEEIASGYHRKTRRYEYGQTKKRKELVDDII